MKYLFSKDLLLRMPVKNPADYLGGNQSFLNDLHFRAALYLASPTFFVALERHGFNATRLMEREEITLRKYINRSNALYFQSFEKNDPAIFTDRYSPDACIMLPDAPKACGPDEALKFFRNGYYIAIIYTNLIHDKKSIK